MTVKNNEPTQPTAVIGPCVVVWADLRKQRRFSSFDRAERFARKMVSERAASPRDVEIYRLHDSADRIATIDMDALGRVWTDIKNPVADILL